MGSRSMAAQVCGEGMELVSFFVAGRLATKVLRRLRCPAGTLSREREKKKTKRDKSSREGASALLKCRGTGMDGPEGATRGRTDRGMTLQAAGEALDAMNAEREPWSWRREDGDPNLMRACSLAAAPATRPAGRRVDVPLSLVPAPVLQRSRAALHLDARTWGKGRASH